MIKKFKLQDYIGVEEYEALSYFDPEQIPEEKAMLKPVCRAILAMLGDISIKRRRSTLQKTFEDTQKRELEKATRQKEIEAKRKQRGKESEDAESEL